MNPKQLYEYALDEATKVVDRAGPEYLNLPTPDTEWTVHDLLQHMVYELAWASDIVTGKTIEEVGGMYDRDLLGNDAVQAWHHYLVLTREALTRADETATAHLSYADKSVGDYLMEAGNDELVHAWDLGQGIGVPVVFDEQVTQVLLDRARTRQAEIAGSGLFGEPVSVSDDASTQTKLLALLGRSENWKS